MASDIFLKIEDVDGESTDRAHPGSIEIFSFSWGVSNPTTISSATGGAGAGKASFQDLHFTSSSTKASPLLAKACAAGTHFPKAVLSVRKSGGQQQDYYKVTLSEVYVSSYSSAGAPEGDRPEDAFSLLFVKIEFDYSPQNADGSLGQPVHFGWDIARNASA